MTKPHVAESENAAHEEPSDSLAAPQAPIRRGSWFDDVWARITATTALRARTEWILFGIVMLVAALLRFVGLGAHTFLIFDETFYVKDAWAIMNLGYEAKWPENANDQWAAGNPNGYLTEPSYVVHPPMGKLLIGLGMLVFGADNPFGWRVSAAFFGTLLVALLYFVARKLFRSPALATIGAGMLAIDGHAISLSRVAILDGFLAFFALLGFFFILFDIEHQKRLITTKIAEWRGAQKPPLEGPPRPTPLSTTTRAWRIQPEGPDWGPQLWWRPWLVAAAIAFACASSVKWSGLFFLAAFCVYSLVVDAIIRKRNGVTFWASAAVLMQGPISFVLTIPIALVTYVTTWAGYLSTTGGFYRTWAEEPGNAWTGLFSWVPLPLQSLWHYSSEALNFHSGLTAEHPYQSSPIEWPFLLRPTAMSYVYSYPHDNPDCTGTQYCVEAITSISNPLIYWLGTVSILFIFMMLFLAPELKKATILVGYAAGYLPWLALMARSSVFHFYAIVFLPFMILATLVVFQMVMGSREDPRRQRTLGVSSVLGMLVAFTAVSALFLPVWTGMLIPDWYWSLTHWLKSWK